MWYVGREVMLLTERGGSGHVRAAPLDYLSFPRFGGFAFSYVPSIISIARTPSLIINFSPPPLSPVLCIYVPLNLYYLHSSDLLRISECESAAGP
jgi:hypothetical protein